MTKTVQGCDSSKGIIGKDIMNRSPVTYTLWLASANAAAVEAASIHGCQGITIDMEHGVFDRSDVDRLILLARESGLQSFVRVAEPTRIAVQHPLDSGATGVIIPHVDSLDHARELTAYAKYPPMGDRSVGGGRTFGYGGSDEAFFAAENVRVRCYPMVETVGALEDVEAILALDCVDGIFLGPADLNMARGRKGEFGAADAQDRSHVAETCRKAGKVFGMNVYTIEDMEASRDIGLTFAALLDDVAALLDGYGRVVSDARRIIEDA